MGCIPAPTCRAALAEATKRWPNRNRASDGICGDAAHQARPSDHNAGNAFDLTDDPAHGLRVHAEMDKLRQRVLSGQERRVKYIISNRRIFNPSVSPAWRPYSGSNPHVKHAHVSILTSARTDTRPWFPTATTTPTPQPTPTPDPLEDDVPPFTSRSVKPGETQAFAFEQIDGKGWYRTTGGALVLECAGAEHPVVVWIDGPGGDPARVIRHTLRPLERYTVAQRPGDSFAHVRNDGPYDVAVNYVTKTG